MTMVEYFPIAGKKPNGSLKSVSFTAQVQVNTADKTLYFVGRACMQKPFKAGHVESNGFVIP
jgi:hypothetical protein